MINIIEFKQYDQLEYKIDCRKSIETIIYKNNLKK